MTEPVKISMTLDGKIYEYDSNTDMFCRSGATITVYIKPAIRHHEPYGTSSIWEAGCWGLIDKTRLSEYGKSPSKAMDALRSKLNNLRENSRDSFNLYNSSLKAVSK